MHAAHHPIGLLGALALLAALTAAAPALCAAEIVPISGPDGATQPAWVEIEHDTYGQRAHFEAGLRRLSAKLDEQIRVLRAKREKMTTGLGDWDFAMKEVDASREYLTAVTREVSQAKSPEDWAAARDKAAEAWKRSQLAVDKMNTTVTS